MIPPIGDIKDPIGDIKDPMDRKMEQIERHARKRGLQTTYVAQCDVAQCDEYCSNITTKSLHEKCMKSCLKKYIKNNVK